MRIGPPRRRTLSRLALFALVGVFVAVATPAYSVTYDSLASFSFTLEQVLDPLGDDVTDQFQFSLHRGPILASDGYATSSGVDTTAAAIEVIPGVDPTNSLSGSVNAFGSVVNPGYAESSSAYAFNIVFDQLSAPAVAGPSPMSDPIGYSVTFAITFSSQNICSDLTSPAGFDISCVATAEASMLDPWGSPIAAGPTPSLQTFNLQPGHQFLTSLSAFGRADVAPVPEPTTLLLLGSGLIGLAGYGRKRKK